MHTKPMAEKDGVFTGDAQDTRVCPKCGALMHGRLWESSCGGFEDVKYTCRNVDCNHVLWVDGIDS